MIWFSLYVIIAFICSYFCFRYFIKSYNSCNCPKKGDLDKYYKDNSVEEIIIIVGAFWLLILIAFIVFSPFIIIEYISSEREEKANREFQKEIAQREEGYTCSNCTFYKIAKCELHKIAVQPEDEICKDFL